MDLRKLCEKLIKEIEASIVENQSDEWRRKIDYPFTEEEVNDICDILKIDCESVDETSATFYLKWDREMVQQYKDSGGYD